MQAKEEMPLSMEDRKKKIAQDLEYQAPPAEEQAEGQVQNATISKSGEGYSITLNYANGQSEQVNASTPEELVQILQKELG